MLISWMAVLCSSKPCNPWTHHEVCKICLDLPWCMSVWWLPSAIAFRYGRRAWSLSGTGHIPALQSGAQRGRFAERKVCMNDECIQDSQELGERDAVDGRNPAGDIYHINWCRTGFLASTVVAMKKFTISCTMYKSYLSSDRTEDNLVKAAPLVQDDFIPEGLRGFLMVCFDM